MKKLFVYGSLLSGLYNWSWALKHSNLLGKTTIEGNYTMVDLNNFPGVIIDDSNYSIIHGEVYEVDDHTYNKIEALEGYPVFYNRVKIDMPNFGEVEMYVLPSRYLSYPIIESGNWKKHVTLSSLL